ncbi:prolactin releasing hormone 2 [Paramormyrops kingsleyae]|uniref:prolactin releasing hormone 2 n=1 Tax=Paramormyrops kingsleyae TaxID=1676925 RepID=UPI003B972D00
MLAAEAACPAQQCLSKCTRLRVTAVYTALLLLSASMISAHSTTLKHDLHIGHSVDNRSPEIDPFWYVGRGVRPIGRFGKRQSASGGLRPLVNSLALLLGGLRAKDLQKLPDALIGEDAHWLP